MWNTIGETFLREWPMILSVVVAGVLGFAIGLERKLRSKEAGIRTHAMVCIGAALITVVSIYGFGEGSDAARVAAQIVSGVGFLGAGIIVYRQNEVKGLTTAAGVWATAGIGMACGTGLYLLAVGITIFIILTQLLQHANFPPFRQKRSYTVKICFKQPDGNLAGIKAIFGVATFKRLNIIRKEDELLYTAILATEEEIHSGRLDAIMHEHPNILSVERCDGA